MKRISIVSIFEHPDLINQTVGYHNTYITYLVELVDTLDLKSNSFKSIGSSPIIVTKMMEFGRHARFRF